MPGRFASHLRRAASVATWPASVVTEVLSPVIGDNSEKWSPLYLSGSILPKRGSFSRTMPPGMRQAVVCHPVFCRVVAYRPVGRAVVGRYIVRRAVVE